MLGGTLMPLYAHTDMDLSYRGIAWPGVALATDVSSRDDRLTFRALGKIEVAYAVERVTASVSATLDYWEAVPKVSYPEFQPGGFNAINNLSTRTPKIAYDDMVNDLVMFKLAVAF